MIAATRLQLRSVWLSAKDFWADLVSDRARAPFRVGECLPRSFDRRHRKPTRRLVPDVCVLSCRRRIGKVAAGSKRITQVLAQVLRECASSGSLNDRCTASGLPGTRPEGVLNEAEAAAHVRKMFGRIAPRYDLLNHLLSLEIRQTNGRRRVARRFNRDPARCECASA